MEPQTLMPADPAAPPPIAQVERKAIALLILITALVVGFCCM